MRSDHDLAVAVAKILIRWIVGALSIACLAYALLALFLVGGAGSGVALLFLPGLAAGGVWLALKRADHRAR